MKITIRRSGGFAGPLLNRSFKVDTTELPPHDAKKIEALLAVCPLTALHNQRFRARGGADLIKYEVTIEGPASTARFLFDESAVPADFEKPWEYLSALMASAAP